MLDAAKLASVLMHIEPRRYKRNVFRCVELSALNSIEPMQPLYDLGASKSGQQFTPIGGPPALYVAETPENAYHELTGLFWSDEAIAHQRAPMTVTINIISEIPPELFEKWEVR